MSETPIKIQLKTLPSNPGVYQYYDKDGKLLYVGKAKNLKKRVTSYFTKNHEYGKTRVLVKKIANIKHIVVETETDALLFCLLYTSPSPRDLSTSRMPSSA